MSASHRDKSAGNSFETMTNEHNSLSVTPAAAASLPTPAAMTRAAIVECFEELHDRTPKQRPSGSTNDGSTKIEQGENTKQVSITLLFSHPAKHAP